MVQVGYHANNAMAPDEHHAEPATAQDGEIVQAAEGQEDPGSPHSEHHNGGNAPGAKASDEIPVLLVKG
ncbi:MAG: hypothetical protein JO202_13390 [Ktedonobacteraceae bacterium]|nr:hypothetical protein [Ktedonobacteraceae bacterium]